eukprot:jgi/Tetstr1/457662/TSEL_004243.t1
MPSLSARAAETTQRAFPGLAGATIGTTTRAWKTKLAAADEFANASAQCYIVNDKGMRTGKTWARKYLKSWDVAACDKTDGFYACLVHHEEKRAIFA